MMAARWCSGKFTNSLHNLKNRKLLIDTFNFLGSRRRCFAGTQRGMARNSWNISGPSWRRHSRRGQKCLECKGFGIEEQKKSISIRKFQGLLKELGSINNEDWKPRRDTLQILKIILNVKLDPGPCNSMVILSCFCFCLILVFVFFCFFFFFLIVANW